MDEIVNWIKQKKLSNIIWVTDLDKTLIDGNINPEEPPKNFLLERALRKIDIATKGRLFFLTGRELSFVDRMFPETKFKASSEYNNIVRFNPSLPPEIKSYIPDWTCFDPFLFLFPEQIHPNIHIRKKPIMRSIHYRLVPPPYKKEVRLKLFEKITLLINDYFTKTGLKLIIQDAGEAFDIGPFPSCKREAYKEILVHIYQNQVNYSTPLIPVYVGDSLADLKAGMFAKEKGGVFIVVGNDPLLLKAGDFFLKSPLECRQLVMSIGDYIDSQMEN